MYLRFSSVLSGEVGVKIFASEDAALSVEIYYNADTDKFGARGYSRNQNEITVQHKKADAVEFEIFVDKCIFEAFFEGITATESPANEFSD